MTRSRSAVALDREHGGPGAPACRREKRGQSDEALGRSPGGFSTQIHVATDGLGNPVRSILTPGQEADVNQGAALIEGLDAEAVLGDKRSDRDAFVSRIRRGGAEAVIPPRANRKEPRDYDQHLAHERNNGERLIDLLKPDRRVATRDEKTARNFLAFIHVASIMVLLR